MSSSQRVAIGVLSGLSLTLAGCSPPSPAGQARDPEPPGGAPEETATSACAAGATGTEAGDVAPDFALEDAGGATIHLRDYCDDVVEVWFAASWDPTSNAMASGWEERYDSLGPQGFTMVNVLIAGFEGGTDATPEDLQEWTDTYHLGFPVVADVDEDTMWGWATGVSVALPFPVLLDRGGVVASVGTEDWDHVDLWY